MQYYAYQPDANKFAGVGLSSADDESISQVHNANNRLLPTWVPYIVHGFSDNPRKNGDFPSLSNFWRVPVFSQKAWDTLGPLIGDCCEALPIVHPTGKPYFIINVMEAIDCLDVDKSEVKRFSDGRIMRVVHYAFKPEMLEGKHIFRLPRESSGQLIVDDVFRDAVTSNALKGLVFKPLPMAEAEQGEKST